MDTPNDHTSTPPGETQAPPQQGARGAASKGDHEAMTVRLAIVHTEYDEEEEGPSSRPTVLMEVDERPRAPTALPAPPPIPALSTFEPRLSPSSIPTAVSLRVVGSPSDPEVRVTRKMPIVTKYRLLRAMRESAPPSFPPPSYRSAA
jgi:hypothetical protein